MTDKENKPSSMKPEYVIAGVIVWIVGFLLAIIGTSVILKYISIVNSTTADYFVLAGLVTVIVGFGAFGYGWAGGFPEPEPPQKTLLSSAGKWSIAATAAATAIIVVIAVVADSTKNLLWTAATVGALGGLVHEIAQSKGTAFLPSNSSSSKQGKPDNSNPSSSSKQGKPDNGDLPSSSEQNKTDNAATPSSSKSNNQVEDYLGGLVGILLGGAAGVVALSVSGAATSVSVTMVASSFAAGVALKGIADAAASSPAKNSTG